MKTNKHGCILWEGAVYPNGYGKIYREGKPRRGKRRRITLLAHRVAYRRYYGGVPSKLLVIHARHCSGNKRCVNPEHLHLAYPQQKMTEWQARNRK